MIKKILMTSLLMLLPAISQAQSFETIDACKGLKNEVAAAVEESKSLDKLFADDQLTEEQYLAQLYEGVQKLSATGQMFFKASDSHESTCKNILAEAGKIEEVRVIYDWYLEPVKVAYQFFRRAREAAIRLNRQGDVDVFTSTMKEYDAAVMKLVSVCQTDLEGKPSVSTCAELSARLGDVLK